MPYLEISFQLIQNICDPNKLKDIKKLYNIL